MAEADQVGPTSAFLGSPVSDSGCHLTIAARSTSSRVCAGNDSTRYFRQSRRWLWLSLSTTRSLTFLTGKRLEEYQVNNYFRKMLPRSPHRKDEREAAFRTVQHFPEPFYTPLSSPRGLQLRLASNGLQAACTVGGRLNPPLFRQFVGLSPSEDHLLLLRFGPPKCESTCTASPRERDGRCRQ